MRVSLTLLAVGTLTTWLLAGPFSYLLASSLPYYYDLHAENTMVIVAEIVTAPATWLTLGVIALGLAAWLMRDRLVGLTRLLLPVADFAAAGLGFEWLNRQIIRLTDGAASALSRTQTGQLNWNVAGIVGGLLLVLAILVWSA
jgi:NADH-quinone oxidoreductase subunit L